MKKEYDSHQLSQLTDQQLDEFLTKAEAPYTEERHQQIYRGFLKGQKGQTQISIFRKYKWLLVAACVLLIPTTVFAGTKLWEVLVERNQYGLIVDVAKPKTPQKWYRLKLGYMPSQLQISEENPLLFQVANQELPVVSMALYQVKEQATFTETYIGKHQETTIGRHRALIANKEGQAYSKYQQVVFLLFEEEGYVLQVYAGEGISEAELKQMLAEISLQESSEEQATPTIDYEGVLAQQQKEKEQPKELRDSGVLAPGQYAEVNQKVSLKDSPLGVKVNKTEVLTSLEGRELAFQLMGEDLIDAEGRFIPYEASIYQQGDGQTTVDEVTTKTLELRFILVDVTVTNHSDKPLAGVEFSPMLYHLTSTDGGYQARGLDQLPVEPYGFQHAYFLNYLDKHGEGKEYAQIPELAANQSLDLQLGYFVTNEEVTDNFLEFNLTLNQYETLADEGRQWIKVN